MNYFIEDTREVVNERKLRKMLFNLEVEDLVQNVNEYLDGELNLDYQCNCIKNSKNAKIEEVIYMLGTNWNVPISEIKENKKEEMIDLLEDKIIEAENETDPEYSEDFLSGYMSGIKMAQTIVEEIM